MSHGRAAGVQAGRPRACLWKTHALGSCFALAPMFVCAPASGSPMKGPCRNRAQAFCSTA